MIYHQALEGLVAQALESLVAQGRRDSGGGRYGGDIAIIARHGKPKPKKQCRWQYLKLVSVVVASIAMVGTKDCEAAGTLLRRHESAEETDAGLGSTGGILGVGLRKPRKKKLTTLFQEDTNTGHSIESREVVSEGLEIEDHPMDEKSRSPSPIKDHDMVGKRLLQQSPPRCGSSWTDANNNCGVECMLWDSNNPGAWEDVCGPLGQTCFADMVNTNCGGSPSSPRCGTSWTDANDNCGVECVLWDSDNPGAWVDVCGPLGESCFADMVNTNCGGSSTSTGGGSTSTTGGTPPRCGTSWTDANDNCGVECVLWDSNNPGAWVDVCGPLGQTCFADMVNTNCGGSPSPPRCGTSWTDANKNCGVECVLWDSDNPGGWVDVCGPLGQSCFADIDNHNCDGNGPTPTNPPPPPSPVSPPSPTEITCPTLPSGVLLDMSTRPDPNTYVNMKCKSIITEGAYDSMRTMGLSDVFSYGAFCYFVTLWNTCHPTYKIFDGASKTHELAAFFGHKRQETGLVHTREYGVCRDMKRVDGEVYCKPDGYQGGFFSGNTVYCDPSLGGCACQTSVPESTKVPGYIKSNDFFYGRGGIQLSWNWNYPEKTRNMNLSETEICSNPDIIADDPALVWASLFVGWMGSASREGWSPHDRIVFDGDFGASLNNINGVLECGQGSWQKTTQVYHRLNAYCDSATKLGLTSLLSFDGCANLNTHFSNCKSRGTCPACNRFASELLI